MLNGYAKIDFKGSQLTNNSVVNTSQYIMHKVSWQITDGLQIASFSLSVFPALLSFYSLIAMSFYFKARKNSITIHNRDAVVRSYLRFLDPS